MLTHRKLRITLAIGTTWLWPFCALGEPEQESEGQLHRAGYSTKPPFGGPNSPAGQIEEADRVREPVFRFPEIYDRTEPWRDWKTRLHQEHGLQLSGHYTTLVQQISDTAPGKSEDEASSGVFRATAIWTLLGDSTQPSSDTGAISVMLDHRHAFGDLAPGDLPGQAGYVGVTGTQYNDAGLVVVNLNWAQTFNDRQTALLVGRYDPADYMNILGSVNPWATFSNLSVMLDSSVAYSDAGWGMAGGTWIRDQWYVMAGFNDANGKLDDDLDFFDGGSELFSWGEFGWSPTQADRYFKNLHLTGWHVDQRSDAGIDSGHGIAFAANWTFGEKWMPFLRAGISDGAEQVKIYDKSIGTGLIWRYARADLLGLGINWGETPSSQEQVTLETFWRFQFARNFAVTPSLQYLIDPVGNPDDVLLFGLRLRLTF